MDPSNENSFIKVLFGDDFDSGQISVTSKVQISQNSAIEQETYLNQTTNNLLDVASSVVLAISVKPENISVLYERLRFFLDEEPISESPENMFHNIYSKELKKMLQVKYTQAEGKIFISIRSPIWDEVLGGILGFQDFLYPVTSETYNSIESTISINQSVDQFLEKASSGDRLLSALLHNSKVEIKASLSKQLGEKAKEVASNIDPGLAGIPPFDLLCGFSSIEFDFQFQSSSELPPTLRQKALTGKFSEIPAEERELPPGSDQFLNTLLDFVETDLEVYFTLSQILAVQLSMHAPDLTKFAKAYLGFLMK